MVCTSVMSRSPTKYLSTALSGVLSISLLIAGPAAVAETLRVDPGSEIAAGKVIIGSGQNLPSMDSASPWDIGSYSASTVIAYYTTNAALDQAEVAAAAVAWTRNWLRRECGGLSVGAIGECRAIAVFDVDDTLLSTYPIGVAITPQFGYDPAASNEAVQACSTPVIQASREAYRIFRSWGMATAIITGRPVSQRQATLDCLAENGMSQWESVRLRSSADTGSAATYKKSAREELAAQGWRIGPSIGDQVSDMSYGSLGRGFLMPNVRYFLP